MPAPLQTGDALGHVVEAVYTDDKEQFELLCAASKFDHDDVACRSHAHPNFTDVRDGGHGVEPKGGCSRYHARSSEDVRGPSSHHPHSFGIQVPLFATVGLFGLLRRHRHSYLGLGHTLREQ